MEAVVEEEEESGKAEEAGDTAERPSKAPTSRLSQRSGSVGTRAAKWPRV